MEKLKNKFKYLFIVGLIFLPTLSFADMTVNLVSYWSFDSSNSNDDVGSNNGSDTAMSWGAGFLGNGAIFNGSSSRFTHSATGFATGASPRSVNYWVKYTTLPSSGNQQSSFKYGGLSTNHMWESLVYNNSGQYQATQNGYGNDYAVDFDFVVDTWYMVTNTFDGSTARIYVNGNEIGAGFDGSAWNTSAGSGVIGAEGTDTYLNGEEDEIGYWTKTLSSDEVLTLYNSGAGCPLEDFASDCVPTGGTGTSTATTTAGVSLGTEEWLLIMCVIIFFISLRGWGVLFSPLNQVQ